ncbi:hypothetical protein ON010_g15556 [Phytophthora cinnamomi]|nr:hypothetical protein ON010_g15556 [Phytophthora cinnamomi]
MFLPTMQLVSLKLALPTSVDRMVLHESEAQMDLIWSGAEAAFTVARVGVHQHVAVAVVERVGGAEEQHAQRGSKGPAAHRVRGYVCVGVLGRSSPLSGQAGNEGLAPAVAPRVEREIKSVVSKPQRPQGDRHGEAIWAPRTSRGFCTKRRRAPLRRE